MAISQEQIKEFKKAKNPEEMIEIAEKLGVKLSLESAKAYFETFNSKNNQKITDNELDNVSGGSCYKTATIDGVKDSYLVVSALHHCDQFVMKNNNIVKKLNGKPFKDCMNCTYLNYIKGLWLCSLRTKSFDKSH